MKASRVVKFSKLLIMVLFAVVEIADSENWLGCPSSPRLYEGCNHTVSATFHSVNDSCIDDFTYNTIVNGETIAPSVVNTSMYYCNVSVEFVVRIVDLHAVLFVAKDRHTSANPSTVNCSDTLDIYNKLLSPVSVNITTKASTNNFTISWLEPYILPGYSIYQYNITISDQNMSLYNEYTSNDTEFEIESEEVNNASCIEIYGVYCGGEGESLFAPLLENDMSSPVNITVEVTCDGVNVTWSVPTVLLQYNIDGYILSIPQLNLTYMPHETEIYIKFADGIYSFHQEYEITVSANVCKGSGQAGMTSFITSNVPKLSDVINYTISVVNMNNVTHVAVTFKAKLLDIDCPLSHPTMVDVMIWCNGTMIVNDTESITVSGNHSDLIIAKRFLPISQNCNVTLNFQNSHKNGKIFYISIKGNDPFEVMTNSNRFDFRYSCLLYCCKATTNNSSCDESKKNNSKQIVQISVRNERDYTCNGSQSLVCYDFVATPKDKISSTSNWEIATIVLSSIISILIVVIVILILILIVIIVISYKKRRSCSSDVGTPSPPTPTTPTTPTTVEPNGSKVGTPSATTPTTVEPNGSKVGTPSATAPTTVEPNGSKGTRSFQETDKPRGIMGIASVPSVGLAYLFSHGPSTTRSYDRDGLLRKKSSSLSSEVHSSTGAAQPPSKEYDESMLVSAERPPPHLHQPETVQNLSVQTEFNEESAESTAL